MSNCAQFTAHQEQNSCSTVVRNQRLIAKTNPKKSDSICFLHWKETGTGCLNHLFVPSRPKAAMQSSNARCSRRDGSGKWFVARYSFYVRHWANTPGEDFTNFLFYMQVPCERSLASWINLNWKRQIRWCLDHDHQPQSLCKVALCQSAEKRSMSQYITYIIVQICSCSWVLFQTVPRFL